MWKSWKCASDVEESGFDGKDRVNQPQSAAAIRTARQGLGWGCNRLGGGDGRARLLFGDPLTQVLDVDIGAGRMQAVVPDLLESGREGMLEEGAKEIENLEAGGAVSVAAMNAILEVDAAIFDAEDAFVGNGDFEDVGSKIPQGGLPVAHGLTVDDPVEIPYLGIDGLEELSVLHGVAEFGLVDFGESLNGEIEVGSRGKPLGAIGGESTADDEIMDMGMVLEFSSPGVQDAGESRQLRADEARVAGKGVERAG